MASNEQEFETQRDSAKASFPRIESIPHTRVNTAACQWWNGDVDGPGTRQGSQGTDVLPSLFHSSSVAADYGHVQ